MDSSLDARSFTRTQLKGTSSLLHIRTDHAQHRFSNDPAQELPNTNRTNGTSTFVQWNSTVGKECFQSHRISVLCRKTTGHQGDGLTQLFGGLFESRHHLMPGNIIQLRNSRGTISFESDFS